jgi:hypothetical protein
MKKVLTILFAWAKAKGWIETTAADRKLSELRLKHCGICEESEEKKFLIILNGNANYENGLKCNKCGCPCLEKSLAVDEKCPLGKW